MGHPTGGGGRAASAGRGCGIAVLVAVVLACALPLITLWSIHRSWDRKPPDVGAFARSEATRTADAGAARTSSGALAKLTSALPWAVPLGTSVADSCGTQNEAAFFGPARWTPISCVRSTVMYIAFDGDIHTRLRQLDAVLGAQGWAGAPPASLTAMATWMGQAGGDPSPDASQRGSTAAPGSQQIALSVSYDPASAGGARRFTATGPAGPRLRVAVAGRPYDPRADTGDLQTPGRPQRLGTDGTTYLAWHPLSTDAVAQSAYRSHAYVAAFSLVTRYFTQRTPATTPPPAPPPGNAVPPCYSGSHCG